MVSYLKNNGYFFEQLKRIAINEYNYENKRIPSIVNTYKNEPEFQKVENLSRNYARSGYPIYKDPFEFHMRPQDEKYNGRNLNLLKTLIFNSNKDKPDVITVNPLKVVNYY